MEIRNIFQPFEIEFAEVDEYKSAKHRNTFFEMVFVLEGQGIQIVNDHQLPYTKDKLFLLFPQDKHSFEVHESTKFLFIRFTEQYLKVQARDWVYKVEYIFHNHNHLPGCILKTVTDKPLVRSLTEAIIREKANDHQHKMEVITQLINTIITISARNIALIGGIDVKKEYQDAALTLLSYVHRNIYNPEQLKIECIAQSMNRSANYISEFFKKHIGQSIQQYVVRYKIKLIEARLQYTDMRLNEIADEFGFTDQSHLNRIFKKYTQHNPSDFRKIKNQL